jgi:hypothetical protein
MKEEGKLLSSWKFANVTFANRNFTNWRKSGGHSPILAKLHHRYGLLPLCRTQATIDPQLSDSVPSGSIAIARVDCR